MAPKDLDKLINKYLQGKCNKEELDFINVWYSTLGEGREQAQRNHIDEFKMSSAGQRMRQHLLKHTQNTPSYSDEGTRPSRSRWSYIAVAASLVLCMAVGYYFVKKDFTSESQVRPNAVEKFTSLENNLQEPKRFILPDGSMVEMSPASKMRFLNDPSSKTRELYLEGEAYFDVARDVDRPFYVYVDNIVTQVLGTTFIIKGFPDETVRVTVKTGKVTVFSQNTSHKKTVLRQNQEAVYDRATDIVSTHEASSVKIKGDIQLHTTEMQFDETPITEVLTVLAKAYNIDIEYNEGGSGSVNGNKSTLLLNENYLTYDKSIGESHNITAMAGYSFQMSSNENGCK